MDWYTRKPHPKGPPTDSDFSLAVDLGQRIAELDDYFEEMALDHIGNDGDFLHYAQALDPQHATLEAD